jgi:hypothetical protein
MWKIMRKVEKKEDSWMSGGNGKKKRFKGFKVEVI